MKRIFILFLVFTNSLCVLAQENTNVRFSVNATSLKNVENIGIRGSVSPLSWEKTYFLQDSDKNGIFEAVLTFPNKENEVLEYKYVYGDKTPVWELEGQNRILLLDESEIQLNDVWNVQGDIDIKSLPRLSAEKLTEDFSILKKALLEVHPGLYRYRTKIEMDSIFDHFQKVFSQSLSYQEAFYNFTKLTSTIQCGHTFPSPYNQNGFIKEVVLNQRDKLPFTFRVLDQKMILSESIIEDIDLPRGTEIIAIDGVQATIFLKETASLVKADGANNAKRYADLNTFGVGNSFEMFDCYFPLLYPPKNEKYSLTIKRPDNESTEELMVNAVSIMERANALTKKYPNRPTNSDQLWKLEFWENNTAYLQLGTFDVFQLSFEWKDFLDNAFKQIKKNKTENLVLDIRWNEGGQDEILLFLGEHLTASPIKPFQRNEMVHYQKLSNELKPYLTTWDNSYFDLTEITQPFDSEFYTFKNQEPLIVNSSSRAFKGNTYLLINAANSSATFYFAEIAKENKLATLIGETTGGSQKGLNGGTMFFLRLPNSQIEIDLPIIGTFSSDRPLGGIEPDILVTQSVEDIIKGEDKVMIVTKKIIQEK